MSMMLFVREPERRSMWARARTRVRQAVCRHADYVHFSDESPKRMFVKCVKCKRETPGWSPRVAQNPDQVRRLPGKPEMHRLVRA